MYVNRDGISSGFAVCGGGRIDGMDGSAGGRMDACMHGKTRPHVLGQSPELIRGGTRSHLKQAVCLHELGCLECLVSTAFSVYVTVMGTWRAVLALEGGRDVGMCMKIAKMDR